MPKDALRLSEVHLNLYVYERSDRVDPAIDFRGFTRRDFLPLFRRQEIVMDVVDGVALLFEQAE